MSGMWGNIGTSVEGIERTPGRRGAGGVVGEVRVWRAAVGASAFTLSEVERLGELGIETLHGKHNSFTEI